MNHKTKAIGFASKLWEPVVSRSSENDW